MVKLDSINPRHLPLVQEHAAHPDIGKTSNVPYPYPADGAVRWFEGVCDRQNHGQSKVFAITKEKDFAGIISLNQIDTETGCAFIDYWVRADLHGLGVATNAVSLLLGLGLEVGITEFSSGCLVSNVGSQRVLEKNRFELVNRSYLESGKFKGYEFYDYSRSCT